jgi:hypothetical protein
MKGERHFSPSKAAQVSSLLQKLCRQERCQARRQSSPVVKGLGFQGTDYFEYIHIGAYPLFDSGGNVLPLFSAIHVISYFLAITDQYLHVLSHGPGNDDPQVFDLQAAGAVRQEPVSGGVFGDAFDRLQGNIHITKAGGDTAVSLEILDSFN